MKQEKLTIVKKDEVPVEVLASSIVEVAQASKKLLASRLSRHTLLVILKDLSGVPMHTIDKVLTSASELEKCLK